MAEVNLALSQDFLTAFARIPRSQQRKVQAFVSKFQANPTSPGINYEVIRDAANPNYRSVRIDQAYRGIVLKPDAGNVYLLMWVDHHDDAYDWATRHKCEVNPTTGALQLYEVELGAAAVPAPEAAEPAPAQTLFDLRDREYRRLGVPEDRLETVKQLTAVEQLDELQAHLPVEVYEALSFLVLGLPLKEVMQEYAVPIGPATVNVADVGAALERTQSRRSFHVLEDDQELQRMLEAPLEKWRVFLHPTQRRLVERDWNGPVRVLGGAGTGKTVVAMHRARWLARNHLKDGEKLLFTTFTRNLATDIEANLRTLCTSAEMNRITVVNIDAWVRRFLQAEKQPGRIVYSGDEALEGCWDLALQVLEDGAGVSDDFVHDEWQQVILSQRITTRAGYFGADRRGRGTPLTRRQRAALWPVFEEMRLQLHQAALLTPEDAMFLAADLLESSHAKPEFRAAVVDEAQDLGPEALTLLRSLVPEGENDLFITGDAHQRIYARRATLKDCGINIIGRGRKLRINYRTTDGIRQYATAVLAGTEFDDLDGEADDLRGYKSLVLGAEPALRGFGTADEEADWVAAEVERLHSEEGVPLQEMCITARMENLLKPTEKALTAAGLKSSTIRRDTADDVRREGVRLATMHRIKGLEFRHVFVVQANNRYIPLDYEQKRITDEAALKDFEQKERSLLHVAVTRAIRSVTITWNGEASPLLPEVG